MKRSIIVIIFIISLVSLSGCSILYGGDTSIYTSVYKGGYWSQNWRKAFEAIKQGSADDFIIYKPYSHPSDWSVKLKVYNFDPKSLKNGEWGDYTGIMKVALSKTDITTKSILSAFELGIITAYSNSFDGVAIRYVNVKIKKQYGRFTYNIYFDNVGVGLNTP